MGVRWESVGSLLDRAPCTADLVAHGLELLGARRLRERGLPVPRELVEAERLAAIRLLAMPALLARVTAAHRGPLMLMKGPECAALYPDPALRGFKDVDLLAEDAAAAQADLLAAGFVEIGTPEIYEDIHHLRPLLWPALPLVLEVHERPKWTGDGAGPPVDAVLTAARPGTGRLAGVLRPAPEHHALLLAGHAFAHEPLLRLRDLLDIALAAEAAPDGAPEAIAREWGCERLWRTAASAAGGLFMGGGTPLSLRTWGRHLCAMRRRTVLETHLARWLEPLWTAPAGRRRAAARAVVHDWRPAADEAWGVKLRRARRAAGGAVTPRTDYDRRHLEGTAVTKGTR